MGTLTRVGAETGSRPSAPRSDGYPSVDLFGAVGPSRDLGCALILPRCDRAAMTLFLNELSGHVVPGAHAILVLDGAGWPTAKDRRWPDHVTPLPAYSPELKPQERVWAFRRQHHLALRRFLDPTALLDACQDAWRRFIGVTGRSRSLCSCPCATVS
jgi:hypothetical protein